jgi:5'-deoxynucleotidase YfbR-like HD superfamily hydrolase
MLKIRMDWVEQELRKLTQRIPKDMTPEERFTKIENALQTCSEQLANFEAENAEYRKKQVARDEKVDAELAELRQMHLKLVLAQTLMIQRVDKLAENIDKFLRGDRPNGR